MGIRVEHGQVSDYAALGVLAGEATAAREAAVRQDAMNRQAMQIEAQQAAQERQYAQQKEMAEFDAYLDIHKYQAAQAWEVEKMELRSRHDFDMVEAAREAKFQNQLMQEQRQQQELDTKLKSLAEKAPVEMGGDGYLTAEDYQDAVMRVKGLPVPKRTGVDFRQLEQDVQYYFDTISRYKKGHDFKLGPGQRLGVGVLDKEGKVTREATPEEKQQLAYAERRLAETQQQLSPGIAREKQSNITDLKSMFSKFDKDTQRQILDVIQRGDPSEIREALEVLRRI